MSTIDAPRVEEAPPRLRWLRWLCAALLVVALGIAAYVAADRHQADSAVKRAMAELDASDPDWRLESIEAARADLPDHENSARLIVYAKGWVPMKWELRDEVFDALEKLLPCERLPEALRARLEEEMPAKAGPVLTASRSLAGRPRGRHQLTYQRIVYSTLLPDQQESRGVCQLWRLEAIRLAEKGDGNGALVAARAAFNAGRSIGDEPFAITQMIRTAGVLSGGRAAERALGLTEPGAKELLALQRLAEDEARFPAYRIALRGERAAVYSAYKVIASGEVPFHKIAGSGEGWGTFAVDWGGRAMTRGELPRTLAMFNRAVAIADAPTEQQARLEAELRAEVGTLPPSAVFTRLLFPAIHSLGDSFRRKQGSMHALAAALAAERYRIDHKKWPDDLPKLVPTYLAAVPADPYDGAPLRYRLEKGSVVVYSIGADGRDNGGKLCAGSIKAGCDIGYRLYDPARRRQPAPEVKKEGEGDGGR